MPLSKTGAELLFKMLSQRYERGSTMLTSNLPFAEWTEILGSERLTGALLHRLTHDFHILERNGDSFHLKQNRRKRNPQLVTAPHPNASRGIKGPAIPTLLLTAQMASFYPPHWSTFTPPLTTYVSRAV